MINELYNTLAVKLAGLIKPEERSLANRHWPVGRCTIESAVQIEGIREMQPCKFFKPITMSNVLHSDEIKFLSAYLARAVTIDGQNHNNAKSVLTAEKIEEQLHSSNNDRESLYDYLEDFCFINDPMFGLFLNALI